MSPYAIHPRMNTAHIYLKRMMIGKTCLGGLWVNGVSFQVRRISECLFLRAMIDPQIDWILTQSDARPSLRTTYVNMSGKHCREDLGSRIQTRSVCIATDFEKPRSAIRSGLPQ